MKPDDFKRWRTEMNLSQEAAADALGISRSSVTLYEAGQRRDDGRPVEIPTTIALACSALELKLQPFGETRVGTPKEFRFVVSAPNDLDHFTVDTVVKHAVDEHDAFRQMLKLQRHIGDEAFVRALQNLRLVRD
jgi:transcriptional regulator with XRE-family HTH domain